MATTDIIKTSPRPGHGAHGPAAAILRRWPTAAGIAASTAALLVFSPLPHSWKVDLSAWSVLLAAVIYFTWGAARGDLAHRRFLTAQTAAVLGFGALAVIAATIAPEPARYLLAAGWLAHGTWDAVHHHIGRVVPRYYAEACLACDVVFAAALLATGWL